MITNKVIDTLRDRGLRLTRPRRIILDVVRATDAHPTAAFVYRRVRRRLPRVSLATVYRNLRMLAADRAVACLSPVKGGAMASLKGSKSFENLKEAFAGESQANRRYLYFARVADIEGFPDIAGLFKDTADAETGHAFGHLDFLKEVGDPVTNVPFGKTENNLRSAVEGETYEYTQMYPGMAKTARDEGLDRKST